MKKIYLIFFIVFFNFIWLAEIRPILNDSQNSLLRYMVAITVILIYILMIRKIVFDVIIFVISLIFIVIVWLINVFHLNFTIFSLAFFIFPFLILIFNNNTSFDKNVFKLLNIFHLIILFYALKVYLAIFIFNETSQLNENEVSSYSLTITISVIAISRIYKLVNQKKLYFFHIFITTIIALILSSRAIFISSIFIVVMLILDNLNIKLKKLIVVFFVVFALIIPIIIIEANELILFIHESILILLNYSNDVREADFSRYEMFILVQEAISANIFGKGIGNSDYLDVIQISGFHSGSLNLLYWGGYILYITFFSIFLILIIYSFYKNKDFIVAMILIYWLVLLNFYEGLLFGNMGLLILYVYLIMSYYNVSRNVYKGST